MYVKKEKKKTSAVGFHSDSVVQRSHFSVIVEYGNVIYNIFHYYCVICSVAFQFLDVLAEGLLLIYSVDNG